MLSRRGLALCVLCLIGGLVGFFAEPYWLSALIVDSCAAAACAATFVGALRRTGRARRSWLLLAGGLALWLIGDLIWDAYAVRNSEPPTLSPADIAYFVAYPLMLLAIWKMLRIRSPRGNREVILDGLALAASATLGAWQFLVLPNAYVGMPLSERIVGAAYPLGDVLLLMALTWLAFAPGRRSPAANLLYAFFGITLILDVAYALVPRLTVGGHWLELVNSLYPFAYSFLGAAALHPDAGAITEPAPVAVIRLHPARIAFLAAALLTAPVLNLGEHLGQPDALALPIILGLIVTILVIARFVAVVRDRESAREQLEYQATHDVLTGLLNRHLLTDRIDHAIARARRAGGSVAVLYVDLDRFKAVNDTHGHVAGDELLVQAAARLVECVRAGDTVARLGGDEFAVLCEDLSERQTVFGIADRIVEALSIPYDFAGGHAVVSASVGIAIGDQGPDTGDSLLRDADAAMYRAKDAGRDRWEVFDSVMRDWVERRRETEAALAGAVTRGELRLMYQPIVELGDASIRGFEALVRWERPGHGLVAPTDFIPLAEETGLIVPIGEWVMNEACRQLARWNEEFLDRAPVGLSVNVSCRQLNQESLRDMVERAAHTSGIDPSLFTLEITESVLLDDAEWALTQLESVKRLGVNIAIDDFGTGYSALSYLRLFPIDIVKIDRSFISDLGVMAADTTVVAAIIALSHVLGHKVVAEGVETPEQLAALLNLGCDFAQGFYFAKPLATAEATARLRSGLPSPKRSVTGRSVTGRSVTGRSVTAA